MYWIATTRWFDNNRRVLYSFLLILQTVFVFTCIKKKRTKICFNFISANRLIGNRVNDFIQQDLFTLYTDTTATSMKKLVSFNAFVDIFFLLFSKPRSALSLLGGGGGEDCAVSYSQSHL